MEKYPIGQQDFKGLIEDGYIYVDKTMYIPKLLENGKYYFLGRPRRFGKSLFLSTLEYFFKGERRLFKGLSIDSYEWDWNFFPVIHLDLNGANYTESKESLKKKLLSQLIFHEDKYGISLDDSDLPIRFEKLIIKLHEKYGCNVVVLVDEYEKPVLDSIDVPEISDYYKEALRGFYGVLKSLDRYLKLVFLTGVTKFGQMSVFSALNNINDISLDDEYGAICGITREELTSNFQNGIEKLAKSEETGFQEALELLKVNYDGYHFSKNCPDIYNPFSIISALSKSEIRPYWFSTGTPSLLVNLLLKKSYTLDQFEGVTATASRLLDTGNQFEDPVSLFYQTGYLTIKTYDKVLKRYVLGFPNQEVELAFIEFIMPYYLSSKNLNTESFILDFTASITNGKPEKAVETLSAFIAGINYDLVPKPEVERHFQTMMYLFSRLILPYVVEVKTEEHTSDGRIDLMIKTSKYIYLIEIKRDREAGAALKQIKDKGYALQFARERRKVFLIGINFSTEKRRLEDVEIEELN